MDERTPDPSHYSINLWNVYDALINNIPRTNNHVEGYNGRLSSHIFRSIEILKDEHLFQDDRNEVNISMLNFMFFSINIVKVKL